MWELIGAGGGKGDSLKIAFAAQVLRIDSGDWTSGCQDHLGRYEGDLSL
jgi:hypothetical protein